MTVLEKGKAKLDAAQRGMSYRLPGYDKSDLQWWTAYIEGAEDQKREDAAAIEALQAEVESMDESCKKQLVAMASHVAELQAAQPHWVSVKERLPEPGEYVLAWEWQGFCVVDRYIDIGDGRWGLSNDGAIYTHWMPLPSAPEPPQEVQE
ncbi:MAG: DUF551 domain-containing protein [Lachnospiraceae bacterium]|nr:DUF551 domain-containing protein [Lachnospiraceae bacterium]